MLSFATSILLLALSLFAFTGAADNTTTPAAVFTYVQNNQSLVFALNVDQSTGDLFIHMSVPSGNAWVGVGIGDQMKDSLMFIAYPSKNQKNVTLSPRVATGHSEPSYYDHVGCALVYEDGLVANGYTSGENGQLTVNAVCHNATQWGVGSLNIGKSGGEVPTAQPFIFAVGPAGYGPGGSHGGGIYSNSPSAPLKRHQAYGSFTLDMTKAVSKDSTSAGVPKPNSDNGTYVNDGASSITAQDDHDPAPAIHAFVMCLSFVIIFSLGSLILRVLHRVILHAIVQGIGLFLVCCATAGGIVISQQYNRSKHFASAHQVIGILLFLALFAQLGLGITHHRIFKKEQRATIMGKIHRYMGPTIIGIGIINGFIGFVFAGNPHLCLPYVIIIILVAIVFVTVRFGAQICCRGRRKKQQQQQNFGTTGGAAPQDEGYQYPQFGPGPYAQPPPAYGRQQSYGDDVPLRPYESQQSVGQPPAYPRPMI